MIIEDAGVRDSAYYSITDLEWPDVRANLQRRLDAVRGNKNDLRAHEACFIANSVNSTVRVEPRRR